jgi:DNA polymerase-3 subunit chi
MHDCTIYFIETQAKEERLLLCYWVEQLYEQGLKIQVVAGSTTAAQHLDQLLWTFSEGSFVPHGIILQSAGNPMSNPVIITIGEWHVKGVDVVVCDGSIRPELILACPITIQFVIRDDEDRRQESRLLWQAARDRGFKLQYLPVSSNRMVPRLRSR